MFNPFKIFKKVAVFVAHGFVRIFGSETAKNFALATLDMLKTAAGQIATRAVLDAMGAGPDDQTKRTAAIAAFGRYAAEKGLTIADSVRDALLQLALLKVKGTFGEQDPNG